MTANSDTNGSGHQDYDVIVMGGGPAGSTCATVLAQGGRKVLVIEKESFPRHHIGESLIPHSYWVFKRIGLLEKLKASPFTKKFSVQFFSPAGKDSRPFYFFETNHHESAVTWQVTRADFDKLLLDHSRENGVTVMERTMVKDVLFEGERATGVEAKLEDGTRRTFRSSVVVDATGLNAILSNKLGLRVHDPDLRKGVIYSYYKDAYREPGIDGGATLVLRTTDGNGWFWYIPLADGVTSVGVVADPDYLFKGRGRDFEKIYNEEIARCEQVAKRVAKGTRCDKVYVTNDFSYRSRKIAGDGWVLIGDAYGFLDPMYSSGVLLALRSGEYAGDAILNAFEHNDFSAARLGGFEKNFRRGMESMRKLVYAFYTRDFRFAGFLTKYPEYRANVIDVLIGDLFREGVDDLYGPMSEFFNPPQPVDETVATRAATNTHYLEPSIP